MPTRVVLPAVPMAPAPPEPAPPKKSSGLKKALIGTAAAAATGALLYAGTKATDRAIENANEQSARIAENMASAAGRIRVQRLRGGSADKDAGRRALIAASLAAAAYALTKLATSFDKARKEPTEADLKQVQKSLIALGLGSKGSEHFHEIAGVDHGSFKNNLAFHTAVARLRGGLAHMPKKHKHLMRMIGGNVIQAIRGTAKRVTQPMADLGLAITGAAMMSGPDLKERLTQALGTNIPDAVREKVQSYIQGVGGALADYVDRTRQSKPTVSQVGAGRAAAKPDKTHYSSVLS